MFFSLFLFRCFISFAHTRTYIYIYIYTHTHPYIVIYFLVQILKVSSGYWGRVLLKLCFEESLKLAFPYEHSAYSSRVERVNMTSGLLWICTLFQTTAAVMLLTPDGCSISAEWSNISDECLQLMRLVLLLAVWWGNQCWFCFCFFFSFQ